MSDEVTAMKSIVVGDTIYTPDGHGKVVAISARDIAVDLANGAKALVPHRDVYLDEALKTKANIAFADAPPPSVESSNEAGQESPAVQ